MSISFQCPQCDKKLKAPDQAAGKSSKCPNCGGMVTCPEPIYDAEIIEATPLSPSGHDPYFDLDGDRPYGMVNPLPAADVSGERRRPCRMCGEMIVATAAKCRYCGEVFDPALKNPKSKKSKDFSPHDYDLTAGDKLLAVLPMCAGIGCIIGIVYMIQGKPKGLKMFGLSLAMAVVWSIVRYILQSAVHQPGFQGGP